MKIIKLGLLCILCITAKCDSASYIPKYLPELINKNTDIPKKYPGMPIFTVAKDDTIYRCELKINMEKIEKLKKYIEEPSKHIEEQK